MRSSLQGMEANQRSSGHVPMLLKEAEVLELRDLWKVTENKVCTNTRSFWSLLSHFLHIAWSKVVHSLICLFICSFVCSFIHSIDI
jgi:RsiW-degrading membrane proteinase PrsW (M82 family)